MRILLFLGLLIVAVLGTGVLLRILNPLPPLAGRPETVALADGGETALGRAFAALAPEDGGLSGVLPLSSGPDSLAARLLLVRGAERTLDLQYYIWRGDTSGRMLLEEIRRAAERGVRVRLLLDDNGTAGLDGTLLALDRQPNIEVRLFNPFTIRRPKPIGYVMEFSRLNRRMHNKSLTADNVATIIGGRNIGDEYFGAGDGSLFADLDVLASGRIVPEVSADFDRYWASRSAYPVERIVSEGAQDVPPFDEDIPVPEAAVEATAGRFLAQLVDGRLPMEWAPVTMVSDDPAKALKGHERVDTLVSQLGTALGAPEREVGLVSAYFVPTDAGRDLFAGLARAGISVTILTNALNATDVAVVHAGYAKHRRALLRAGVRLFEMKGEGRVHLKLAPRGSTRPSGGSRPVLRSQGTSLHAKTFTVDRERLFVGSFNFDPRSTMLNTELGFLIESPGLANQLQEVMDEGLGPAAYEVRLAADGRRLMWVEETPEGPVVHATEPNTGPLQRAIIAALSVLPIDWML